MPSSSSSFVQHAGSFLSKLGWVVLKVKFKRSCEYESRKILLSLFENLLASLISMRDEGNVLDINYSQQAMKVVSEALDQSSLSSLASFIPNLLDFIPDVIRTVPRTAEADTCHWQLVFLLSKLLGAILSLDRHIMLCLDDLQWCGATTLGLITEMLLSVSQCQTIDRTNRNLMVVEMYRDNEVINSHPLQSQMEILGKSSYCVSEIKLTSLSRDDIVDMLAFELRLTKRLVLRLGDVVHKKTSGHALCVVQLLNSLVCDSTISYSPRNHRFDWDDSKLRTLKTCDSVASLIVSNLSFLTPKYLQTLRVLSCFGTQSVLALIRLLDNSPLAPQEGFESSLPGLVEQGVIEVSDEVIIIAHDLIQQHVYETIPEEERMRLHHDLGLYLGNISGLDATSRGSSIEGGVEHLFLSDASSRTAAAIKPSALKNLATSQINAAGTIYIVDATQRTRFAEWNLCAGKDAVDRSNFEAALFNFENGIAFLNRLWLGDSTYQLCRELHEGAAFASLAIGNTNGGELYAHAVIDHVQLEDSLFAQYLLVRSLEGAGKYSETIARGLAVLRSLGIKIPSAASPETVIQSMRETANVTSQYTTNQLTSMKQSSTNAKKRRVLNIIDFIIVAAYRQSSPFLPLVAFAAVNYSLQNGVCQESATAFAVYGYFHIFLQQNFKEGRRWGDLAGKIMDPNAAFTSLSVYGYLSFWFMPHIEVQQKLIETYEIGMRNGDVDNAMYALCISFKFGFFGGQKLSVLMQSYKKSIEELARYNEDCMNFIIIDSQMVDALTGIDSNPLSVLVNENTLLAVSKLKNNTQGVESIYNRRFFSAFWNGNYVVANKWYDEALSLPSSKMPKIMVIPRVFYRGLIAYQLYRNGEGEEWLDDGNAALNTVEFWQQNASKEIFENKLVLLEAEQYASNCNIVAAKESYELSAKIARDNGLIHEQGLAFELYGKFLSSITETTEASHWYQRAYQSYTQWGATAKATRLHKEHNFVIPDETMSTNLASSAKHGRDEETVEET